MLADTLKNGSLGVCVALPDDVRFSAHTDTLIDFTDAEGVRWMILHDGLALDLSDATADDRARDVEDTARGILRFVSGLLEKQGATRPKGARVDDPTWTPVIENEVVTIDGRRALKVLHRTMYQPGYELVMGHLVLPTRAGVLEIRTLAMDRTTGWRESASRRTPRWTSRGPIGDVNGDGYGDLLVAAPEGVLFVPGSERGPVGPQGTPLGRGEPRPLGDVDGDGFADVALHDGAALRIYGEGAEGPRVEPLATERAAVEGDGADDLGVQVDCGWPARLHVFRGDEAGMRARMRGIDWGCSFMP